MKHEKIRPSQRKRYEFIEFQLTWEGAVGRKLLQKKFEISLQQATLDLTGYLDLAPKNMGYDPRQRTYVTRSKFKPIFLRGNASEYLIHLEMLHHGYHVADEIWPATVPPFDAVSVSSRQIDPVILKTVLHAIRDKKYIEVMYVSLSSVSETPRRLLPHAIANDGHRWHVRAYDSDKERYSDFVLSRIEKIAAKENEIEALPEDKAWSSYINLCLQPDPQLSERRRQRLEIEYDMEDGALSIKVRQAMLFYYLRFYGFNPYEMDGDCMSNKSSFHLTVKNLTEVEKCLGRR